jgi:hypothetical protein
MTSQRFPREGAAVWSLLAAHRCLQPPTTLTMVPERCRWVSPPMRVGVSPSGKAADFDSAIPRFESSHPSHFPAFGSISLIAGRDQPTLSEAVHAAIGNDVKMTISAQTARDFDLATQCAAALETLIVNPPLSPAATLAS